eukprot:4968132-Prymnesium_polylepis.1
MPSRAPKFGRDRWRRHRALDTPGWAPTATMADRTRWVRRLEAVDAAAAEGTVHPQIQTAAAVANIERHSRCIRATHRSRKTCRC